MAEKGNERHGEKSYEEQQGRTAAAPPSNIGVAVKDGIVTGLRGINEIEVEMIGIARTAVSGTLRATGDLANEGFDIASGVVRGALRTATDVGTDAATTLTGALEGVGNLGTTAARSATGILVEVADGVREVFGALLPRSRTSAARQPAKAEETEAAA